MENKTRLQKYKNSWRSLIFKLITFGMFSLYLYRLFNSLFCLVNFFLRIALLISLHLVLFSFYMKLNVLSVVMKWSLTGNDFAVYELKNVTFKMYSSKKEHIN